MIYLPSCTVIVTLFLGSLLAQTQSQGTEQCQQQAEAQFSPVHLPSTLGHWAKSADLSANLMFSLLTVWQPSPTQNDTTSLKSIKENRREKEKSLLNLIS